MDWRLQLPALNTDECETWIQVQNVGNVDTKALLVLWDEPGWCPPQAFGPLKVECTGLLRPGSAWSFSNRLLPSGARSGIMYSMNATDKIVNAQGNLQTFADVACTELFSAVRQDYDQWAQFDEAYCTRGVYLGPIGNQGQQTMMDFGAHQGEPLAVTVNRTCPDSVDPNLESSAAYVGISTDREGIRDPRAGQYAYYAPLVWADYFGMNSIIHIQNSGVECTSVELWFQRQGDCIRPVVWNILSIAPGESYPFDPNEVVGPNWQGAVWLRTSQPMGVVVDTLGANHFGAYHGVPADVFEGFGDRDFTLGTQVNYAPLIYREHQGWETSIQVQNLSSTHNAKVKVSSWIIAATLSRRWSIGSAHVARRLSTYRSWLACPVTGSVPLGSSPRTGSHRATRRYHRHASCRWCCWRSTPTRPRPSVRRRWCITPCKRWAPSEGRCRPGRCGRGARGPESVPAGPARRRVQGL